ncbi:MAG: CHAP domain-containing protein [Candidatus Saccharibacteria bacterium]
MGFAQRSTVAPGQKVKAKNRKRAKGIPQHSTIAIYVSVFALIAAVVAVGYHAPQQSGNIANATSLTTDVQTQRTSVNELVATNIAANLAETTNLSIAANVANLSVSLEAKGELAQTDGVTTTKPQILQPTADSRTIISYSVKAGDTIDSLSTQFGISKDTIKWANNLTSDALIPNTVLQILPKDGVQYTVKAGDTLQAISQKYSVDQERVVLYNDLDVTGLTPGAKIILPNASLPATERPGYVTPRVVNYGYGGGGGVSGYNAGFNTDRGSAGNRYGYGQCTWYAYERRMQLGMPVGSFWGNASSWASAARGAGYLVNNTPSAGAVMQNGGGYGHVAIIESVDPNGDVHISEMNNSAYGGWNIKSYRTMTAGQAANYNYIH